MAELITPGIGSGKTGDVNERLRALPDELVLTQGSLQILIDLL
jgi:hypothetical protein